MTRLGNMHVHPKNLAIIIGVDKYAHGYSELEGIRNDIPLIENVVMKRGFMPCVLTGKEATRDTILSFLQWVLLYCKEHSIENLWFVYSGHGRTIKQKKNETDVTESWVPFDSGCGPNNLVCIASIANITGHSKERIWGVGESSTATCKVFCGIS